MLTSLMGKIGKAHGHVSFNKGVGPSVISPFTSPILVAQPKASMEFDFRSSS